MGSGGVVFPTTKTEAFCHTCLEHSIQGLQLILRETMTKLGLGYINEQTGEGTEVICPAHPLQELES